MNSEKLTADFSFEMPERCDLTSRDVLGAATDVMREIPFFQQRRKDGGLFKQKGTDIWKFAGSPETAICAVSGIWSVIISPVGGHRFHAHAFKPNAICTCPLQSFRLMEKQAA